MRNPAGRKAVLVGPRPTAPAAPPSRLGRRRRALEEHPLSPCAQHLAAAGVGRGRRSISAAAVAGRRRGGHDGAEDAHVGVVRVELDDALEVGGALAHPVGADHRPALVGERLEVVGCIGEDGVVAVDAGLGVPQRRGAAGGELGSQVAGATGDRAVAALAGAAGDEHPGDHGERQHRDGDEHLAGAVRRLPRLVQDPATVLDRVEDLGGAHRVVVAQRDEVDLVQVACRVLALEVLERRE